MLLDKSPKPILPMVLLGAMILPKAVVKGILASLDEKSIIHRIKHELEAKLLINQKSINF